MSIVLEKNKLVLTKIYRPINIDKDLILKKNKTRGEEKKKNIKKKRSIGKYKDKDR